MLTYDRSRPPAPAGHEQSLYALKQSGRSATGAALRMFVKVFDATMARVVAAPCSLVRLTSYTD
jgi:hypothetical protein